MPGVRGNGSYIGVLALKIYNKNTQKYLVERNMTFIFHHSSSERCPSWGDSD